MIKWFKDKSSEFAGIAAILESTFNDEGKPIVAVSSKSVDVDAVKNALNELGKATRYSKLADYLKADKDSVWDVLSSNPTVFEQVGRGWWKLKQ